jgi:hypothetical protein
MPLYGDQANNYLLGIVDCFIEVGYQGEKQYILCEYKPKLNSISTILGQVRIYKEILYRNKQLPSIQSIKSVIVTFDNDSMYDELLMAEGIKVFRIIGF